MTIGSFPGSTPIPSRSDQEMTAATEALKARFLVTSDLLDIPLALIGKEARDKTSSTSSNPTLDMPLLLFITDNAGQKDRSPAWVAVFQELLNRLPASLAEELANQSRLALDQRSPQFAALDAALGVVASALSAINTVKTAAEETLAQTQYSQLAGSSLSILQRDGEILADLAADWMGHYNDLPPYRDAQQQSLQDLRDVLDGFGKTPMNAAFATAIARLAARGGVQND